MSIHSAGQNDQKSTQHWRILDPKWDGRSTFTVEEKARNSRAFALVRLCGRQEEGDSGRVDWPTLHRPTIGFGADVSRRASGRLKNRKPRSGLPHGFGRRFVMRSGTRDVRPLADLSKTDVRLPAETADE